MTTLLVTGAAGFIGSNFVRYWSEHHPDDDLVAFDALDVRGRARERGRRRPHPVRAGRHRRRRARRGHPAGRGRRRRRELRRRVAQQPRHPRPGPLLPHQRARHAGVVRGGPARRRRPAAPRLDVRGLRRPRPRRGCRLHRGLAVPAPHAVQRQQGRRRPRRAGLPRDVGPAGHDHELRQQLRAATSSRRRSSRCFTTRALDDQPLPMYASTQNRREWIHALDHCRAIDLVLDRGRVGDTYHVGTGEESSIEEIADARARSPRQAGERSRPIVPDRPGHDRRYLLDWSKIRAELGWEPTIPFERGIAETIDWYADNRAWWEPLRQRAPVVEDAAWAKARESPRHRRRRPARPRRRRRPATEPATTWSAADHAALDVTDRDAVLGAVLVGAARRRHAHARHGRRSTPARPIRTGPSPHNALAVRWVAEACRRAGAHLVHVSTDYVFSGDKAEPYVEWDEPAPRSVYGRVEAGRRASRRGATHPAPRSCARRGCAASTAPTW